jgi:hypothetical protein
MGAVVRALRQRLVSHPRSSNRTCGATASGCRLVSSQDTRRRSERQAFQAQLPHRPRPAPEATLRSLPSSSTGLPRLLEPPFRRAVPTTPADQAGAHVDCFPAYAAFPNWPEGRHPHCQFRGLLRLYSRYGPPDRSAALRRPLSRGSNPAGYPTKPLASYRTNRQLSG